MALKTKVVLTFVSVILIGVVIGTCIFLQQNPLVTNGYTQYNNTTKTIDLMVMNKGTSDIRIEKVWINKKDTENVQLLISHTNQFVASHMEDNPLVRVVPLNQEAIQPEQALEEHQAAGLPNNNLVHYGIRVSCEEEISAMSIQYKYYGLTFKREIILLK